MKMEEKLSAVENIWNRQPRLLGDGEIVRWSDIGWNPFTLFGQRPPQEAKRYFDERLSIVKKSLRSNGSVMMCHPLTDCNWTEFLLTALHDWMSLGDAFDGVGLFVNEKVRMTGFAPEHERERLSTFGDRKLWVGL